MPASLATPTFVNSYGPHDSGNEGADLSYSAWHVEQGITRALTEALTSGAYQYSKPVDAIAPAPQNGPAT